MQAQSVRNRVSPVKIGIILTTLITAFVHLYLAGAMFAGGMNGTMFILNGGGYLGLLLAFFLPQSLYDRFLPKPFANIVHSVVRIGLILYTILTIVLWVAIGMRDMIAYSDKLVEVILVILLWLDRPRSR
jgi:hypothetical protein